MVIHLKTTAEISFATEIILFLSENSSNAREQVTDLPKESGKNHYYYFLSCLILLCL